MARPTDRTGLPTIHRFITTHDDNGKAIFSSAIDDKMPFQDRTDDARFALGYATNTTPVSFTDSQDIKTYKSYLSQLPGIMIPGGSVLRVVDIPPGQTSPMHRTVSLDYGVVLEGEIELILESGESRIMKPGDVSVQRGTNHAWKNTSPGWSRMLYVLVEAKPVLVGGKALGEDYGGMADTRPSQ